MKAQIVGLFLWSAASVLGATDKGSLVQVPEDYGGIEVPVGGSLLLKKDLLLPGSSTEVKVFAKASKQDNLNLNVSCTLYYEADAQRRKIPANLLLNVTAVTKDPQSMAPAGCWKDGQPRESSRVIYALSTSSGFSGNLYCGLSEAWVGSEQYQETDSEGNTSWKTRTIACRHSEIPDVSDLASDLEFWASPDLLEKVIGFQ